MPGWTAVTRMLRRCYTHCQWCNIHYSKYRTGYLECHHLGTRGHGNNSEYRLCPMNLIVVCQTCHAILEPFAKVRVQLTSVTDLGEELEEVSCCNDPLGCSRFKERLVAETIGKLKANR